MARISSYAQDQDITSADKLIGSDGGTTTKNYSIASISKYFKETNAAGVAGQFSWMLRTAGGHDSGEIKATFSSGLTFANLTSVKMSKFVYKETLNSVENGLSILNSKDILIANVNDFDTYGLFEAGTVTRDGSTDFYDLALTHKSSNGSMVSGEIYTLALYGGKDLTYTHDQVQAAATWTIAHNLGKFPSVSIKFSTGAEYNNTGALGGVTYTDSNNLTINLAAAESGVAYLN